MIRSQEKIRQLETRENVRGKDVGDRVAELLDPRCHMLRSATKILVRDLDDLRVTRVTYPGFAPSLKLDANYRKGVILDKLAVSAETATWHISRLFARSIGLSPVRYLVNRRIERAQKLLLASGTVSEVACQAGFYDQAHLSPTLQGLRRSEPRPLLAIIGRCQ